MNPLIGMFGLGGSEVILILAVVLILFGAKKLPELAKGLGQGIREFKKATSEVTHEIHRSIEEEPHRSPHSTSSVHYPNDPAMAPGGAKEKAAAKAEAGPRV